MTSAAQELDRVISTTIQAWARVYGAWLQAMNDVFLSVQDLIPAESNVPASNETEVYVPALSNDTALVITPLTGPKNTTIGPERVALSPAAVSAGTETTVRVTVTPPAGSPPGTYHGTVSDPAGTFSRLALVHITAPPA